MLPDQADSLINRLNTDLAKAKHEISIFTPAIDEYSLVHSLKEAAKKGVSVRLITDDAMRQRAYKTETPNQASHLSLFQNISVFTLPSFHHDRDHSSTLYGSLVCIDDKTLFVITGELSRERLRSGYAFGLHQERHCSDLFTPLLERSKPY